MQINTSDLIDRFIEIDELDSAECSMEFLSVQFNTLEDELEVEPNWERGRD